MSWWWWSSSSSSSQWSEVFAKLPPLSGLFVRCLVPRMVDTAVVVADLRAALGWVEKALHGGLAARSQQ